MFQAAGIIGSLANLAIIAVVAYFFITKYQAWRAENAPREEHERKKTQLRGVAVIHPEENDSGYVDPDKANARNLKFGRASGFKAGQVIMGLPTVDPIRSGKSSNDPTVLAAIRMVVYRKNGREESSDIALTNTGGITGLIGGKQYVFDALPLTDRQKQDVEDERQEVVEKQDKVMPNLLGDGRDWIISRAMGENKYQMPGQHTCSYLQVTSALEKQEGFGFPLTARMLDMAEHDMFDVLATNEQDDQIFYAFWVGDVWHCFLGRELTEAEASGITVQ